MSTERVASMLEDCFVGVVIGGGRVRRAEIHHRCPDTGEYVIDRFREQLLAAAARIDIW